MSLANSMFVILILLNFGGGLCGDDWPDRINCPAGSDHEYFNWALGDIPFPPKVFVHRDFTLARRTSSHQNFSRSPNCGPDPSFTKNLCHTTKDSENCVLDKTSLCVRSATAEHSIFLGANETFAMHGYHCDDQGNKLYYALALYEADELVDTSKLPKKFEPDINLVSTSDMQLLHAQFYLFSLLPKWLGSDKTYFAVGFVYIKVSVLTTVTGVNVGGLPGNEWPKWVKCSEETQLETYDWAFRDGIRIPELKYLEKSDLNFTRETEEVCGPKVNLCNTEEKDFEECAFDRASLCVRSTTAKHPLFQQGILVSETRNYHCDELENQFYYAVTLYRVPKSSEVDVSNLPPSIEPEVRVVSISLPPKVQTAYARFYLFHLLPDLKDEYVYFAVGFVYLQGNLGTIATGVAAKTAPS